MPSFAPILGSTAADNRRPLIRWSRSVKASSCSSKSSRRKPAVSDHVSVRREKHHVSLVQIDLDFDLVTLGGEVFPARRLLGRPTILVLLRYLG